jgi:hypothetical protein
MMQLRAVKGQWAAVGSCRQLLCQHTRIAADTSFRHTWWFDAIMRFCVLVGKLQPYLVDPWLACALPVIARSPGIQNTAQQ